MGLLWYQEGTTLENDLFVFGEDFGTGEDNDHFHCGFTTQKLLEQIEELKDENGLYHLDATYW